MKTCKYISKSIATLILLSILAFVGNESFFHHHYSSTTIENSHIQHSDVNHDAHCLLCDLVKNFQKFSPLSNDFIIIGQVSKINNFLKLNNFTTISFNQIKGRAPPTVNQI